MIKLVFLTSTLEYGGAERQLVTLARGLDKTRFQITVLQFYSGGPLEKDLDSAGIRIISLEKKGRWDLMGFLIRLYKVLNQIRPDVLHGYLGVPNIFTIIFKPLFPKTRMVWGVRSSNMDLSQYGWLSQVCQKAACVLSKFADLIVVNSNAGFEYSVKLGYPKEKIVVIHNGIDTEKFKPDIEAGKRVRAEWGIKENEILIGLVGRLDPMKDHKNFLRAASLLMKKRKNIRFVCVGNGSTDFASELHAFADRLCFSDALIWAGVRKDMTSVYNALDISTSSSFFGEGFPNIIGESMSCGIPCVVTDVGDSAYAIGKTGVRVPKNNPERLAEGWQSLLSQNTSQWQEIKRKARQRIIENFSVQELIAKTEKILLSGN